MDNNALKSTEAWVYRIRYTQQMLWASLKKIGMNSNCPDLRMDVSRAWFSAYNYELYRLLPDGNLAKGAPNVADLAIRTAYVRDIADGLKQRPRGGEVRSPRAKYILEMYEYDLLLAHVELYLKAEAFVALTDINPYEASAWETSANTVMHVAGTDEPEQILYKPFTDEDTNACPL
jgi:hypothetical protein